jgi:hypothetical protein
MLDSDEKNSGLMSSQYPTSDSDSISDATSSSHSSSEPHESPSHRVASDDNSDTVDGATSSHNQTHLFPSHHQISQPDYPMAASERVAFEIAPSEEEESEYRYKFPVKSAIVAVLLLLIGLTCLSLGIYHFASGQDSSFSFVMLGSILIIPGAYQCYIIFQAWRRKPGFSFSQLAAFEGH